MTTPPTGGSHTFLVRLCGALAGRGWRLSFVAQPGPDATIPRALERAGGEVRTDLWRARHLPEERAARLARWVNAARPDAYVVSTSPDAGWLALPLLDRGVPTLSIAHNDVAAYYEPLTHYADFVDRAVGVSENICRKLVSRCGVPPERVERIPYGVETLGAAEAGARAGRAAGGAGGPLRIAYVGRVVQEQKRVMDFARLAAELEGRGVRFELHLIGDGPERGRLAGELERRGLAARARFYGWLSPEEVRAACARLDVFALMSDYEGLPVALLEAMGRALVPVVTDIESGNGEVVSDGSNGFVVPVGDIATFADRLELLAGDRARLASLAGAAWETSQSYRVERMADRYVGCFARARSVRGGGGVRGAAGHPVMPSCVSRYPLWLRKLKWRASALFADGQADGSAESCIKRRS